MNEEPSGHQPRIAIVDDEPVMRRLLAQLLSSNGFSPVTFDSGESFLEAQSSEPSACVLLDLSLPGLSGFEVRARLAESQPRLPVILLTGHADPALRAIAEGRGFAACLFKPVDPSVLLSAISQALQRE